MEDIDLNECYSNGGLESEDDMEITDVNADITTTISGGGVEESCLVKRERGTECDGWGHDGFLKKKRRICGEMNE